MLCPPRFIFDWHPVVWGGSGVGFLLLHRKEALYIKNTAKPRRNCSGEALRLTT